MTTLTIKVMRDDKASTAEMMEGALRAARTGIYEGSFVTFSSHAQLFEIFTAKRMALIEKLQQAGPLTLRGLARAVGRDVKRVHEDVAVLIDWFAVERDEQNKLVVPYDHIRFDIDIDLSATAPEAA